MRYNLMFPMRAVKHWDQWGQGASIGDVANLVEQAGFDAFSMSEHPYPDKGWLANGGHHAFDPFVSLSFAAAATSRIRVMTYILVSGYRNPYLTAKAAASLDVLSGGRFTLGTGAGYLKSEFEALNADFGRRGALLDEAIAGVAGDVGRARPRRTGVRGERPSRPSPSADRGWAADLDRRQRRRRPAPGCRGGRRLDADGGVR